MCLLLRAGGTQRLTRLVGPARAKDLIFTARFLSASEALRFGKSVCMCCACVLCVSNLVTGLVDYVASDQETASDRATTLARAILPNGTRKHLSIHAVQRIGFAGPLAVRAAKLAIDTGSQLDM